MTHRELTAHEKTPLLPSTHQPTRLDCLKSELIKLYAALIYRSRSARDARFDALDGLRACAFLWVCAYHTVFFKTSWPLTLVYPFRHLAALGWCGVSIFLALSGFLMSLGLDRLLRQPAAGGVARSIAQWLAMRFLRIWPSLAVAALISQIIVASMLHASWRHGCGTLGGRQSIVHFWLSILGLTENWQGKGLHRGCSTMTLWSVAVECQFYAFLPLFAMIRQRSKRAATMCVTACVVFLVWLRILAGFHAVDRFLAKDDKMHISAPNVFIRPGLMSEVLYYRTHFRAAEFFVGVLSHYAYDKVLTIAHSARSAAGDTSITHTLMLPAVEVTCAIGFAGFALIECALQRALAKPMWLANHRLLAATFTAVPGPCVAVTTAAAVAAMCGGEDRTSAPFRHARWLLSQSFLYPIASISYTSYLMSGVMLTMEYIRPASWMVRSSPLDFFSYVIVSCGLGLALAIAVERPCMAISRMCFHQRHTGPAPAQRQLNAGAPRDSGVEIGVLGPNCHGDKEFIGKAASRTRILVSATVEWLVVLAVCSGLLAIFSPKRHAPRLHGAKNSTCAHSVMDVALYPPPRMPSHVFMVDRDVPALPSLDLCPGYANDAHEQLRTVHAKFGFSPELFGTLQAAAPSDYTADLDVLFPSNASKLGRQWVAAFEPENCVNTDCDAVRRNGQCRILGGVCANTCRFSDAKLFQVATLAPAAPTRLVIFLHDYGQDGWQQATSYFEGGPQGARLQALAEQMSFALATISARTDLMHATNWMPHGNESVQAEDDHITRAIDVALAHFPTIDARSGVYLVGWAQGADMAISYACTHSSKIAGFWAVAPTNFRACNRPVSSSIRALFEILEEDSVVDTVGSSRQNAALWWNREQLCDHLELVRDLKINVIRSDTCAPDSKVRVASCGDRGSMTLVTANSNHQWPVRSRDWPARALFALFDGEFHLS